MSKRYPRPTQRDAEAADALAAWLAGHLGVEVARQTLTARNKSLTCEIARAKRPDDTLVLATLDLRRLNPVGTPPIEVVTLVRPQHIDLLLGGLLTMLDMHVRRSNTVHVGAITEQALRPDWQRVDPRELTNLLCLPPLALPPAPVSVGDAPVTFLQAFPVYHDEYLYAMAFQRAGRVADGMARLRDLLSGVDVTDLGRGPVTRQRPDATFEVAGPDGIFRDPTGDFLPPPPVPLGDVFPPGHPLAGKPVKRP